jgi:signal transduction histidine kinase
VIITGGLHSPIAPVMLVPPLVTVSFLRWNGPARMIVVGFVAVVGLLLILPSSVTGPPIAAPYFEIVLACNLVMGMAVGCHTVIALSDGFSAANRMLHSVREQAIDAAGRRAKSVEQVGAKVAHELKNPLAAVKSLLQLEVAAARDPRSEQRFVVMTREVGRMEAILRDYLSFARPLEDICVRPMDLGTVADNVAALLEGRAAAAGIHLERKGGAVPVPGDSRRLEEALLNLAANALEATPRGGRVVIETMRSAGEGVLRVRDSGIGMDPSVLDKIGTPFFTTRAEGTGLGVVLARAVIVQHGGRLEFSSRPTEGTIATVTLPSARPDGEPTGLAGEVNGNG